jgi:hypothetical protein
MSWRISRTPSCILSWPVASSRVRPESAAIVHHCRRRSGNHFGAELLPNRLFLSPHSISVSWLSRETLDHTLRRSPALILGQSTILIACTPTWCLTWPLAHQSAWLARVRLGIKSISSV